jgi:hypothetical protein
MDWRAKPLFPFKLHDAQSSNARPTTKCYSPSEQNSIKRTIGQQKIPTFMKYNTSTPPEQLRLNQTVTSIHPIPVQFMDFEHSMKKSLYRKSLLPLQNRIVKKKTAINITSQRRRAAQMMARVEKLMNHQYDKTSNLPFQSHATTKQFVIGNRETDDSRNPSYEASKMEPIGVDGNRVGPPESIVSVKSNVSRPGVIKSNVSSTTHPDGSHEMPSCISSDNYEKISEKRKGHVAMFDASLSKSTKVLTNPVQTITFSTSLAKNLEKDCKTENPSKVALKSSSNKIQNYVDLVQSVYVDMHMIMMNHRSDHPHHSVR